MSPLSGQVERLVELALEEDLSLGDATSEATIEAGARGAGRFAVVAARFNALVVDPLVAGALDGLKRHGVAERRVKTERSPLSRAGFRRSEPV